MFTGNRRNPRMQLNRTLIIGSLALGVLFAEPLTQSERDKALSHFHATRKLLLDSVAGLSYAQWNFKPAPERWSIARCADHIARRVHPVFLLHRTARAS